MRPSGVCVSEWSRSPPLSGVQLREPPQSRQAGREAVLATPRRHEWHEPLQASANRALRDREHPGLVAASDERVTLLRCADEDPVVEPLRLDELELALEVRAGEDEDDSTVDAVVLEHAVGQHRTVARPAPDHPVQADVDVAVTVERVARIGATRVGSRRALEPLQVVAVEKGVVALGIGAERGIVLVADDRQRRAARSAAFARRYRRYAATFVCNLRKTRYVAFRPSTSGVGIGGSSPVSSG